MPKSQKDGPTGRQVPYVKGFRRPTQTAALRARGDGCDQMKEFQLDEGSFKPIPKCFSQDDWLAQYCEEGQTFPDFKLTCPWLSRRKRKSLKQKFVSSGGTLLEKYPEGCIYLVPLGTFDGDCNPDFKSLVQYAHIFFGLPVKTLPSVELCDNGKSEFLCNIEGNNKTFKVTARFNEDGKYQLNIQSVLAFLRSIAPDDGLCTIALTMSDLYEEKPDLFVAGMAAGNHRVGVFSFCRYDPNLRFSSEFWYKVTMQPKKRCLPTEERRKLLLVRSCRLLVHEIAHLLGVDHCIYFECCMNGSGHLEEDFRQPMFLCPVDLRKLQHLCGFDVVERYQNLRTLFHDFEIEDEVKWLDERLKFIMSA